MSTSMEDSGEVRTREEQQITYDECFDLLSNHRRRYTLHYLQRNEEAVTLGDLSEQVAAWENGISVEDLSYDERKRVYTSLQQVHLPRMDDASVVTFDDREGVIEIGPAAKELDIYLEIVQGKDVPWSAFYLGLAVLNASVLATSMLGFPVIGTVSYLSLAVFVVTTFFVASLAHLYVTRTEMQLGKDEKPPDIRE